MSYSHKGSRDNTYRQSRPKKRKFYGTQIPDTKDDASNDNASAQKLATTDCDDVPVKLTHFYRIIEFVSVFSAIQDIVQCKVCKRDMSFDETGTRGLGFKIAAKCNCGTRFIQSGPLINNGYEINRRITFVMRILGVSLQGINVFCALMDIGKGLSRDAYDRIIQHIHEVAKASFAKMSLRVAKQEMDENEKRGLSRDSFKVSGDGSWKKRGFSSLYGVTTFIAYYSGKVIDLVVKSSFCNACKNWKDKTTEEFRDWYENHEEECASNHSGNAGKMEVDSVKEMFSASLEKFGVRYQNYIGDGDSKTFKAILDLNPYGDEYPVRKSECVNHVEKRMGTRLRNVKKEHKLGGKGKLTDSLIKKMTKYYGLAIMRNSDSVEDMQRKIMATYYHYTSTDKKPRHEYCPVGEKSWCKFQHARSLRHKYTHPQPLHPDVAKHILPIYEDLSKKELLERCLGGCTQNANESFNATIWRFAPKHLHCGRKIVEIAAYIAAGIFNEGYMAVLKIMHDLQLVIGTRCRDFADTSNSARVDSRNRHSRGSSRAHVNAENKNLLQENEFHEEVQDLFYGPGIAD